MNRRRFLRETSALPVAAAVAGCAAPGSGTDTETEGTDGDDDAADSGGETVTGTPLIPRIDDPPKAVYLPGHRKSMHALEPVEAGDYAVAPMLTYPHPFWVVTGTDGHPVEPAAGRGVHLMIAVWDPETETVVPVDIGPRVTIERDDERVASRSLWPMLSQEMGFHFGDNVVLPADGTYTAEVVLGPIPTRRTGSFEGRFADRATATFEFTYDETFREDVVDGIELLDRERWGKRGALAPMTGDSERDGPAGGEHAPEGTGAEIPYSALRPADEYPGTRLIDSDGEPNALPRSDDAAFVVTLLEPETRLAGEDDRQYLLVSPRTPYNRVPLANASLRATVDRDGAMGFEGQLEARLDGEFGHHYGRSVADVRPGDTVRIDVDSPPQTARHQGYETAFLEMESLELVVPDAAGPLPR
ncbi:DUF7350 domain-containing protein [Natrinema caseinilyticum]|uniref:DUF7350 domain-containing protein n=1 Tax=Natrinema caseinilyticum TaxID=2961570 RepID=UPI0020C45B2C|nr:hypothetical protein [Natrinema caseinilyticum]